MENKKRRNPEDFRRLWLIRKLLAKAGLTLLLISVINLSSTGILMGDEGIKGYMINEYYTVLTHHQSELEGNHGFWFRRIYFTYDNSLSSKIEMRLRFEMNSPGDFVSKTTLIPVVKDAYLNFKWQNQAIRVGIQSPPTFDQIEDIWGYRSLEKTPLDLLKIRSSRDFGVAIKGSMDKERKVTYTLMYGNGSSNKAETNQGKIIYGRLGFHPVAGLYLEIYSDYETPVHNRKSYVYQGFVAYQGSWGRIALQLSNKQVRQGSRSFNLGIISVFTILRAGERIEVIGRYDHTGGNGFNENFFGQRIAYIPMEVNVQPRLIIGALSWNVAKNIWIIPNLKYVFYHQDQSKEKPEEDLYANLTLWFKF